MTGSVTPSAAAAYAYERRLARAEVAGQVDDVPGCQRRGQRRRRSGPSRLVAPPPPSEQPELRRRLGRLAPRPARQARPAAGVAGSRARRRPEVGPEQRRQRRHLGDRVRVEHGQQAHLVPADPGGGRGVAVARPDRGGAAGREERSTVAPRASTVSGRCSATCSSRNGRTPRSRPPSACGRRAGDTSPSVVVATVAMSTPAAASTSRASSDSARPTSSAGNDGAAAISRTVASAGHSPAIARLPHVASPQRSQPATRSASVSSAP